jgi:hypothetical protein
MPIASFHRLARRRISIILVRVVVVSFDPFGRVDVAVRKWSAALDRYSAAASFWASSAAHAAQRMCSAAAATFPNSSSRSDRFRQRPIRVPASSPRWSEVKPSVAITSSTPFSAFSRSSETKPQFGHSWSQKHSVDLSISGGRKSRSGEPKRLVLVRTCCSLNIPQTEQNTSSESKVVILRDCLSSPSSRSRARRKLRSYCYLQVRGSTRTRSLLVSPVP